MEKNNRMEQYLTASIRISMYCVLPMIGFMVWVLFVPILFYGGMMTSVDAAQGLGQTLFIFSLPMLFFFAVVPVSLHLKKRSLKELGLKFSFEKKNIVVFVINSFITIMVLGKLVLNFNSPVDAVPVVFQLCAIGISEEILCRGILYFEIKQGFHSNWLAIVLSSVIFAFLFHSGDTDLANLMVRLPLGVVLALLRSYTGNVYSSIIAHIWYNSWLFII